MCSLLLARKNPFYPSQWNFLQKGNMYIQCQVSTSNMTGKFESFLKNGEKTLRRRVFVTRVQLYNFENFILTRTFIYTHIFGCLWQPQAHPLGLQKQTGNTSLLKDFVALNSNYFWGRRNTVHQLKKELHIYVKDFTDIGSKSKSFPSLNYVLHSTVSSKMASIGGWW